MKNEIVYPSSNRVGKFNVLTEHLVDGARRPMLQALFGLCVILGVTPHESGRGNTYIAASDLFEPLLEGEDIPEYRIEHAYDTAFAAPDHEARRINSGRHGFVAIRTYIVRVPPASFAVRPKMPGLH